MCCSSKKCSFVTVDNIILVILLVIVLSLFSLPIIFFYISADVFSTIVANRNNSNNINDSDILPHQINCSTFPVMWSNGNNTGSTCYLYTGSICEAFLAQWYECATSRKGSMHVSVSRQMQMNHENTLETLGQFLVHYKRCSEVALPFLCQYLFPLTDCRSTGLSYSATREDCLSISTGVCADLWDLGLRFNYGLPDCYSLPSANASTMSTKPSAFFSSIDANETDNMTCRDDFFKNELICEPRCSTFKQSSDVDTLIMIYSEVIAASISLTLSIVTIILSIKNYKTMFKYPSILILFQVIDITILSLVIIITASDRDHLYCSSVSLLETLDNPTPFCKYSGALFHYSIVNLAVWWLFHVAIFFHKVMFPFQANRNQKLGRNKYKLAAVIVFGLFIPLPAVIICLTVESVQYNIYRFPPNMCTSSSDMWFYSNILPINLFIAFGILMLIVALWSIRKKSRLYKSSQFGTAEKKIVLVFTSVLLFSLFSLGYISSVIARSHRFKAALTQYFECEAFGHVPGKCDRKIFEKMYSPYLSAVTYILLGLVSLSILNFVIKWQEVAKTRKHAMTLTRSFSRVLKVQVTSTSETST